MKCPIIRETAFERKQGIGTAQAECGKELCSWWDDKVDACAVLALSQTIIAIGNILGKLADRHRD